MLLYMIPVITHTYKASIKMHQCTTTERTKALADVDECFSLLGTAFHARHDCLLVERAMDDSDDEDWEEYSDYCDDECSEESEISGDSEECSEPEVPEPWDVIKSKRKEKQFHHASTMKIM